MRTSIKKWGNSAGTVIPVKVLAKAGLSLGDDIDIVAVDGQIVLKPATPEITLEGLLKGSSHKTFELDEEDRAWLREEPVGKEAD